jgi:hypothetical protein
MLIDLNMTISNDLEATLILDHNLSPLIQMNVEVGVNSNTTLVAHAVTEQGGRPSQFAGGHGPSP